MIYYPLSILMLAKIKDILIISSPEYIDNFKDLFGDGSNLGINLSYAVQEEPNGIAEAFIIGEEFIQDSSVALILGDNIFYGHRLIEMLENNYNLFDGAVIFGYGVNDPERFGVVEVDKDYNAISIEEKPKNPKSNLAVTGLYFYDNSVIDIAKKIKPSHRGELEITDINNVYLKNKKLKVEVLRRGFAWLDTGTYEGLIDASNFIRTIELRQGYIVACIEEIAYNNSWISKEKLAECASNLDKNSYGKYISKLLT